MRHLHTERERGEMRSGEVESSQADGGDGDHTRTSSTRPTRAINQLADYLRSLAHVLLFLPTPCSGNQSVNLFDLVVSSRACAPLLHDVSRDQQLLLLLPQRLERFLDHTQFVGLSRDRLHLSAVGSAVRRSVAATIGGVFGVENGGDRAATVRPCSSEGTALASSDPSRCAATCAEIAVTRQAALT